MISDYGPGTVPEYLLAHELVLLQVLDAIKGGEVLSVPNSCDPKISELIYSCWRYESEFRPKFSDVS